MNRTAALATALLAAAALEAAPAPAEARQDPPSVTFFGFDYSLVRMFGTEDFNEPDAIFPGYLDAWNALWLTEMVEKTERAIGPMTWSFATANAANQKATVDQIVRVDGGPEQVAESHLDPAQLATHLATLDTGEHTGLGLIVVVDRLVKPRATGCAWIVYFDIASRTPTVTERVCEEASGFGFRNYWFHPLKDMVDDLKHLRPKE